MAISMLKIRRPLGRLIFNMGIAIPGKTIFLIETAPWRLQMEAILPLGDTCRAVDAHVCSEANITSVLHSFDKNTVRHTAHTIVSWPHPSDLMIIIRQSIYILSIITREVGKLKTHSPTYCIMDNWYNMPYPNHTLDKIYLTIIL